MLKDTAAKRAQREILDVARSGADPRAARRHIAETLQRTLGFDQWSWAVADPVSGLGIAGIGVHDYWGDLRHLLLAEQQVNPRRTDAVTGTGGWGLSFRRELQPRGLVDEIRYEIRDHRGAWGSLDIVRSDGRTSFSDRDRRLVQTAATGLLTAARRSVCGVPSLAWSPSERGPGTLLVDRNLVIRAATAQARAWVKEIAASTPGQPTEAASASVLNVASRAWARHLGFAPSGPARTRVRTSAGTWLVIEAEGFDDDVSDVVAVTIAAAHSQQVLDLRLIAHGLTAREEQLVRLLLQGCDTRFLAGALGISVHTVQDHLKSIFSKVGVESRKQLIAHFGGDLT